VNDFRKFVALLPRAPEALATPYDHTIDVAIDDPRAVVMWWLPAGAALPAWPAEAMVWEVDERAQWDDADRAPGVKFVSFLHRRPTLTRAQFGDHWSQRHAPLARKHHPAIVRYVQNVVVAPITDDTPEIDGVAELSYVSVDDMKARQYDSDEGKRIITEDVARFLQLPGEFRVLANEVRLRVR
jgi:uncharacterized protein (TIGR02118 family)